MCIENHVWGRLLLFISCAGKGPYKKLIGGDRFWEFVFSQFRMLLSVVFWEKGPV